MMYSREFVYPLYLGKDTGLFVDDDHGDVQRPSDKGDLLSIGFAGGVRLIGVPKVSCGCGFNWELIWLCMNGGALFDVYGPMKDGLGVGS